jgi:hypothetical protein
MTTSLSALEQSIARKYKALSPYMDERGRRLWAAAEMRELGHGGATIVRKATGMDWKTIRRGACELAEQDISPDREKKGLRIRRQGGGRKALRSKDPTLLSDLDALIEPTVRGDPMSGIRWTCKSTRKLAEELCQKGHKLSHTVVSQELRKQKYSLQGNRKTDEGSSIRIEISNSFILMKLLSHSSNAEILSFRSIQRRRS